MSGARLSLSSPQVFSGSLLQEPLDMMIFNRLSRILNLRKLSVVWSCVSKSVIANGCATLDWICFVFFMLTGPTMLDVVAAWLLFLFHTLLVEVESWMFALWPALVVKWAVLRYPVQNLLDLVSVSSLMRSFALPGNVEVQSPEFLLEKASALRLQVPLLGPFVHVSFNELV